MRDYIRARLKILEYFNNPPDLIFPSNSTLNHVQPELQRLSERPTKRASTNAGLAALSECLSQAVHKLKYGKTARAEWDEYFRFSGERIRRRRKPRNDGYVIEPDPRREGADVVNVSRDRAVEWFKNKLIPALSTEREKAFIVGDPGAGKSTFVKYLICTNAKYLKDQGIVFSRFEFQKFLRVYSDPDASLEANFTDYMSYILLRDLLQTLCYSIDATTGERRRNHVLSDRSSILDALHEALPALSRYGAIEALIVALETALEDDGVAPATLREVPVAVRVFLIRTLREPYRLVVVMDGLDVLTIEDMRFDTDYTAALNYIIDRRDRLTTFGRTKDPNYDVAIRTAVAIPSSTLFVMRENTLPVLQEKDGQRAEIRSRDDLVGRVGKIDPEVALFNLLHRSVANWKAPNDDPRALLEEFVPALYRSCLAALALVNHAIHAKRSEYSERPEASPRLRAHVLGLFDGNLRHLLEFIEDFFSRFIEDAIAGKLLVLSPTSTAPEIADVITRGEGRNILKAKSYRIVETLLFENGLWFENRVVTALSGGLREAFAAPEAAGPPILRDNRAFTGVVDNIFNYHVKQHGSGGDSHCLLEKIRCIQVLDRRRATRSELASRLVDRFGYISADLGTTLAILMRSEFVSAWAEGEEIYYRTTAKGRIAILHLGRTMSYLEHVYYRTLLPQVLIPTKSDKMRGAGVDNWALQSIRNVYVLLTYLRYVERNPAGGVTVSQGYQIYEPTKRRVLESLERILTDPLEWTNGRRGLTPEEIAEAEEHSKDVAERAVEMLRNTTNRWRSLGLVE